MLRSMWIIYIKIQIENQAQTKHINLEQSTSIYIYHIKLINSKRQKLTISRKLFFITTKSYYKWEHNFGKTQLHKTSHSFTNKVYTTLQDFLNKSTFQDCAQLYNASQHFTRCPSGNLKSKPIVDWQISTSCYFWFSCS